MSKWKIYTPEGVQDILFEECFIKRNLEGRMRSLFRTCGYNEVETPSIEFYDVFSSDMDQIPQEMMFKFFDQQGRILVLKPDITVPIARIAATKYKDISYPLKFFYIDKVFRYNHLGGGKQKEFTQAGVEIMGVSAPEADAEVIATAINAMKAAGIDNFKVDIGQVEFFKGLMEETGLSAQDIEQMRVLIDSKNYLGIEELVRSYSIREELKELILSLPGLFGSIDVIDRVEKIKLNKRSVDALANLRQVIDILEDYELGRYISIDFGMVQSLDYYTGIIFRGFTHGVGFPVLSGGRYDSLVAKFGRKLPATGFSLEMNMIMTALQRQSLNVDKPVVDSMICYSKEGRKTAFKVCEQLRKQGLSIEMDLTGRDADSIKEYAKSRGIGGIIYILNSNDIEIHNIESEELTKTSINELMNNEE